MQFIQTIETKKMKEKQQNMIHGVPCDVHINLQDQQMVSIPIKDTVNKFIKIKKNDSASKLMNPIKTKVSLL